MCGRYFIDPDGRDSVLLGMVDAAAEKAAAQGLELKTGEIFPGDCVPALACDRRREPAVFPMRWGFPAPRGGILINARSETAAEKPTFAESARLHRCLLPATNYFEWTHGGKKEKYALAPAGGAPFYLAGLYTVPPGERTALFAILTRAAAADIAFIHDRMPLILPAARARDYLTPETAFSALLPAAETDMIFRNTEAKT